MDVTPTLSDISYGEYLDSVYDSRNGFLYHRAKRASTMPSTVFMLEGGDVYAGTLNFTYTTAGGYFSSGLITSWNPTLYYGLVLSTYSSFGIAMTKNNDDTQTFLRFDPSSAIYDNAMNLLINKTSLGTNIVNSSLTSVGNLSSLTVAGNISQTSGNANLRSLGVTGNCNLSSGSTYQINGVDVLTSTALGSGVTSLPPITLDKANSRVGINNATPAYTLDIAGDVNLSAGCQFKIAGVPIAGGGVPTVTTSTMTIKGTTTDPTKSTANTHDYITVVDDGSGWCECSFFYLAVSNTAAAAGSGNYYIVLPGTYQFDSTYHNLANPAIVYPYALVYEVDGATNCFITGGSTQVLSTASVQARTFNSFSIITNYPNFNTAWGSSHFGLNNPNFGIKGKFRFKKG